MENIEQVNAAFPEIFSVFFFLLGACVGSFLNVCVYRIAAGKSIVNPPSHCACGAPIKFYNNIPILSWFLLRGRAACCGRKISFRYPLVEMLTAFVFLGMWLLLPFYPALVGMAFASLMIFCTFFDFDTMTLPDFATVGGAILGFVLSVVFPDVHSIAHGEFPQFARMVASGISSATGAVVGAGVVYWFRLLGTAVFRREAMGEGDIILAGCIGAFCGWQGALFSIFAGSLIGALVMIPIVAASSFFAKNSGHKKGEISSEPESEDSENGGAIAVAFGPWLALGGVLYYMFFSNAVIAYFATIGKLFL